MGKDLDNFLNSSEELNKKLKDQQKEHSEKVKAEAEKFNQEFQEKLSEIRSSLTEVLKSLRTKGFDTHFDNDVLAAQGIGVIITKAGRSVKLTITKDVTHTKIAFDAHANKLPQGAIANLRSDLINTIPLKEKTYEIETVNSKVIDSVIIEIIKSYRLA